MFKEKFLKIFNSIQKCVIGRRTSSTGREGGVRAGQGRCGRLSKKMRLSGDEEYVIFEESSNGRQGNSGLFFPPLRMERGSELHLRGEKRPGEYR